MERKGKIARVFLKENGETVAWNIFDLSSLFEIAERGQVFLTDEQVARLNQELKAEGLQKKLSMTRNLSSLWVRLSRW